MPKMQINRVITIDAPQDKVFAILSDFHHWSAWSPWLICDPDSGVTVRKDGKFYEWAGKRVGSGNMNMTNLVPEKSIEIDLEFLKPWKSKAKVYFYLEGQKEETKVTWLMDSRLPFFLFWMKKMMEAMVGADYERGLNMLKDYVETGTVGSNLDFRGESVYPGCTYLGIKTTTTIERSGIDMERDFGKIWSLVEEQRIDPSGDFFSIYHQWDFVNRRVIYTAAVPVLNQLATLPQGWVTGKIPQTKIYTIRHTGAYKHLGNAWTTLNTMQRSKEFKPAKGIDPFEIYLNMPGEVPDNQLITDVNFAIR